jgi:hypothetical protein
MFLATETKGSASPMMLNPVSLTVMKRLGHVDCRVGLLCVAAVNITFTSCSRLRHGVKSDRSIASQQEEISWQKKFGLGW